MSFLYYCNPSNLWQWVNIFDYFKIKLSKMYLTLVSWRFISSNVWSIVRWDIFDVWFPYPFLWWRWTLLQFFGRCPSLLPFWNLKWYFISENFIFNSLYHVTFAVYSLWGNVTFFEKQSSLQRTTWYQIDFVVL